METLYQMLLFRSPEKKCQIQTKNQKSFSIIPVPIDLIMTTHVFLIEEPFSFTTL